MKSRKINRCFQPLNNYNLPKQYNLIFKSKKRQLRTELPVYEKKDGPSARDYMIDQIALKSQEFRFSIKTLELATIYIDNYLNTFDIQPKFYQLLTITALSMAAKFHEIFWSNLIKLQIEQDKTIRNMYEREEYEEMEIEILTGMGFQLNHTTISDYLVTMECLTPQAEHLILCIMIHSELCKQKFLKIALAIIYVLDLKPQMKFKPSILKLGQHISNVITKYITKNKDSDNEDISQSQLTIDKKIKKRKLQ
ncbi:hypothetical protein pb186bvf_018735 [Paramecium bursaria]